LFRSLGFGALAAVLACACAPAPASKAAPPPPASASAAAFGPCIVRGAELCFNALDDNCNGPIDEGCGLEGGIVQFVIAWQPPQADVDLEVFDPSGTLVELGRTTQSGLLRDRDCPGASGECKARSLENVYLAEEDRLTRGKYQVIVRLERWTDLETPVRVNFSGRLGQRSFGTELTFNREKQEHKSSWEL
jgi:tRNA (guanosine-2'-O-)-methyltransferase